MPSWAGKVVLVTGAGQACGRAIAEDFGGRGASVVVMSSVTSDLTAAPRNGLYGATKGASTP